MFREALGDITFETIEDFCKQEMEESVRIDYKEDFPRNLEKTMSAFANTYGGIILIGIEETDNAIPKLPIKGIELKRGLQERVTAIALRGIYPPLFPEIKVCEFEKKSNEVEKRAVIIVRIQESASAPHAVENKKRVYIRVGRQNEPASIDTILQLSKKREEALENRNAMIKRALNRARMICGNVVDEEYTRKISVVPLFPQAPLVGLDDLYTVAKDRKFETYVNCKMLPMAEGVLFQPNDITNRNYYEYAEISQQGLIYYLERMYEVYFLMKKRGQEPITDLSLIITSFDKVLQYAFYFFKKIGFWGMVRIGLTIPFSSGLKLCLDEKNLENVKGKSLEKKIEINTDLSISEMEENYSDILQEFVKKLAWSFGWKPTQEEIEHQINKSVKRC